MHYLFLVVLTFLSLGVNGHQTLDIYGDQCKNNLYSKRLCRKRVILDEGTCLEALVWFNLL